MGHGGTRARGAAGALAGLLSAVLLPGPSACHRAFACREDGECELDGRAGSCEPSGDCSFADAGCPSGRRYGEHARASVAGTCVVEEGTTGTTSSGGPDVPPVDLGAPEPVSTEGSSSTGGGGDPCVDGLRESEPLVVTEDGQVIAGLRIVSDGGPALAVEGFTGVTIRDCEIHHRGGPGLVFRDADDLRVERVVVIHDGAPPGGPHADSDQANVVGSDSERVVLEQLRVVRGASGIDLEGTPGVRLSFIEAHDIRGPGEAACVRVAEGDGALLEDFSCENPLDTARPGDLIELEATSDAIVRRGLLDGHNAEFGYGVHFSQVSGQHSGGLVEDVDAIRMTNGSFSCFPFGNGITFRRTRARENICEILSIELPDCGTLGPNGGCVPGSGGLSWAGSTTSTMLAIEESAYFALCSDAAWPLDVFMTPPEDLVELDFEPRAPIRTTACWESL